MGKEGGGGGGGLARIGGEGSRFAITPCLIQKENDTFIPHPIPSIKKAKSRFLKQPLLEGVFENVNTLPKLEEKMERLSIERHISYATHLPKGNKIFYCYVITGQKKYTNRKYES